VTDRDPDVAGPASGGSDVRQAVADNLRRARLAGGHSLRELAELTGVSKALLSQMERCVANPTVEVLVRVSAALDLTFAELTRAPLLAPEIIRADQGPSMVVDDLTIRTLFVSSERRRFELAESVVPPGAASSKSSHGQGSIEHAYVVAGQINISSLEWDIELGPGDSVRFSAEHDHTYRAGGEPARVLSLVSFSDD
jgi:transcriptional regulator with XRE-family HTH domain